MTISTKRIIALTSFLLVHRWAECVEIGSGWNHLNRQLSHIPVWKRERPSVPGSVRSQCSPAVFCDDPSKSKDDPKKLTNRILCVSGGQDSGRLEKTVGVAAGMFSAVIRTLLPPAVACARGVIAFYRALPRDAILAQAGLVYCFCGGYYPTLFAAHQAARQCGWKTAVQAVDDLAHEATKAIDASTANQPSGRGDEAPKNAREIFMQKTMIVFATVDPVKINQAAGALYTTWMGVEAVLQREFAKTIALSMTIQGYLQPIVDRIIVPPAELCVAKEYHKWIPVLLEWSCKAAAMSVAWRIQRVLSATTSAIAGGLMFSRALVRMMSRRGWRIFGLINEDHEETALDEVVGVTVAGLGLYSQIGSGFTVNVPFPLNLVTWPFDCAEKWIQWQITEGIKTE